MQFNQSAIDKLEDKSIPFLFLTGKAGTGKSTLVRHWIEHTKKRVVKLAPTGIAAMQIQGMTIHKFFGSITQYPITPAYALTIHKSQGLTLQKIHVDFESGCFSPGQAYVAISRCKTLEGITIQRSVRHTDFATHEDAAKLTEAKKN